MKKEKAIVPVMTDSAGLSTGLNPENTLRGVQIGLWNKNAKRTLPLINRQFTGRKNENR